MLKTVFGRFFSGVAAGVLVSIGGIVFLSCKGNFEAGGAVGAVLFSVALLCICYKEYSLFTGKVGYLAKSRTGTDLSVLFLGLAGNFAGAVVSGFLAAICWGSSAPASWLAAAKLGQTVPQTLIKAFFCGILMYLAVSIFREKKTPIGILFCIPVFILSGFEHSIADIFYLAAGFEATSGYVPRALLYILLVLAGNAAGSVFIALFDKKEQSR
ncbi:MAG: formate/nitrite transporter family protein [Clostridia bacterium]|nr:formate/nitrite transporter family protein [Clostridia bacterium]